MDFDEETFDKFTTGMFVGVMLLLAGLCGIITYEMFQLIFKVD